MISCLHVNNVRNFYLIVIRLEKIINKYCFIISKFYQTYEIMINENILYMHIMFNSICNLTCWTLDEIQEAEIFFPFFFFKLLL